MKLQWSNRAALAAAISVLLLSGPATADDTKNMLVTASVAPACLLNNVPDLAFGTLDQTINNDAQTTITWRCTNGVAASIKLNGGSTTSNISARAMTGPATLGYQLYTDAGRNTVFGDGVTGTAIPVTGAGYGSPGTVSVYGRVTQANAAAAPGGNYTDTVVVLIDL